MNDISVQQEKRFAVVMYGGVSLAIYMFGVAQELYRLVKATATGSDPNSLKGSQRIYREIADKYGWRFVIDVLSGTSAGGINAVYLAKALATGQNFDALERLWVDEGDLGRLLYDRGSLKDTTEAKKLSNTREPPSLLNGQRMYEKLFEALGDMSQESAGPLVDQLDLYVTATDLQGLQVPIRLADDLVYERQHRGVFRFCKRPDPGAGNSRNDFTDDNDSLLAFAARATSSFPFAFEPVRGEDFVSQTDKSNHLWSDCYLPYLNTRTRSDPKTLGMRAFADGGYLDNKPFSYAIEAIVERGGGFPVDRKLLYIEPSPEQLDGRSQQVEPPPNALQNVFKAMTLARYETIQGDLLLVRHRNELVERVRRILLGTKDDIYELDLQDQPPTVNDWLGTGLDEMDGRERIPYAGYLRLRVARLTDELAGIMANELGVGIGSDEFLALRYLVRSWRDDRFSYYDCSDEEGDADSGSKRCFMKFILLYDIGFHLRRLDYVITSIDELLQSDNAGSIDARGIAPEVAGEDEFNGVLVDHRKFFSAQRAELLRLRRTQNFREAVAALELQTVELAQRILAPATEERRRALAAQVVEDKAPAFAQLYEEVAHRATRALDVVDSCKSRLGLDETGGLLVSEAPRDPAGAAEWLVCFHFRMFPHYDVVAYPILQTPDLGEEIAHVDVIQVRPSDPARLCGSRLGHFGAFCDRTWRRHDILCGRLDGAEKLISALLPGPENEADRRKYIEDVKQEIMEEMADEAADRRDLIADVLLAGSPKDRSDVRWSVGKKIRGIGPKDVPKVIRELLSNKVNGRDLRRAFDNYTPDESLDPHFVLQSASRALRVTGRLFEKVARGTGSTWGEKLSQRIARVGAIATSLIDAVVPGTWYYLVLTRALEMVLVFSGIVLTVGLVLNVESFTRVGGWLLGVSGALKVTSIVVRSAMERRSWRPLWIFGIAVLSVLVLIGMIYTPTALRDAAQWLRSLI